jgi:hypothetical protein
MWMFCTYSKKPPIHILRWFFTNLRRESHLLDNVRVDEDGALARSSCFCQYIRDEDKLDLNSTGGYASHLNGAQTGRSPTRPDACSSMANVLTPTGVMPLKLLLRFISVLGTLLYQVHLIMPGIYLALLSRTCTFGPAVF